MTINSRTSITPVLIFTLAALTSLQGVSEESVPQFKINDAIASLKLHRKSEAQGLPADFKLTMTKAIALAKSNPTDIEKVIHFFRIAKSSEPEIIQFLLYIISSKSRKISYYRIYALFAIKDLKWEGRPEFIDYIYKTDEEKFFYHLLSSDLSKTAPNLLTQLFTLVNKIKKPKKKASLIRRTVGHLRVYPRIEHFANCMEPDQSRKWLNLIAENEISVAHYALPLYIHAAKSIDEDQIEKLLLNHFIKEGQHDKRSLRLFTLLGFVKSSKNKLELEKILKRWPNAKYGRTGILSHYLRQGGSMKTLYHARFISHDYSFISYPDYWGILNGNHHAGPLKMEKWEDYWNKNVDADRLWLLYSLEHFPKHKNVSIFLKKALLRDKIKSSDRFIRVLWTLHKKGVPLAEVEGLKTFLLEKSGAKKPEAFEYAAILAKAFKGKRILVELLSEDIAKYYPERRWRWNRYIDIAAEYSETNPKITRKVELLLENFRNRWLLWLFRLKSGRSVQAPPVRQLAAMILRQSPIYSLLWYQTMMECSNKLKPWMKHLRDPKIVARLLIQGCDHDRIAGYLGALDRVELKNKQR